tara:strand:- start:981 stop:3026 length:2046 start_codon:yes stop_codon:yes gene_type:complete
MTNSYKVCNPPSPGCPNWENIMYGMSQSELLEYTSKPYQIGPDQFFPLTKEVISNESAKEKQNNSFNEVTISEEKFDSEKIKRIYNDLFYLINKKGKKSHTSIIEQSTDRVHPEININLDDKISSLEEEMSELNNAYISGSLPQIIPQHPIYNNGLIVQNGDTTDNVPIDPSSLIFYLQQGFKRPITHVNRGYYIRLLRQAEGETVFNNDGSMKPVNVSSNFRYLSNNDLNLIPNGEDIDSGTSLNLKTITDQGPNYTYDKILMRVSCEGVEKFHKYHHNHPTYYDYDLSEYTLGGVMGGYWYIDTNASCKVTYQTSRGYNYTSTIPGGTTKVLDLGRDPKWYGHEIGGTADPLDFNFYNPNGAYGIHHANWTFIDFSSGYGNGGDTPQDKATISLKKWKAWGDETPFPSIRAVSAGSRIKYQLKSPFNKSGNIVDGGEPGHWLNGTIDSKEETEMFEVPEQEGLFDTRFDKKSIIGTRMINFKCSGLSNFEGNDGCYGNLWQELHLQNFLDDETNAYYYNGMAIPFPQYTGIPSGVNTPFAAVYGQPILKVNGKYSVFLASLPLIRHGQNYGTNYNYFVNIQDFKYIVLSNSELEGKINGYKRKSNTLFDWKDHFYSDQYYTIFNNPTLYFPGLQGVNLNTQGTTHSSDDNLFNPQIGGSNTNNNLMSYSWGKSNLRMNM